MSVSESPLPRLPHSISTLSRRTMNALLWRWSSVEDKDSKFQGEIFVASSKSLAHFSNPHLGRRQNLFGVPYQKVRSIIFKQFLLKI